MSAEFVLRQNENGAFSFVYQTEHGQVLLTSGAYDNLDTAWRRLQSARLMSRKDRNYEVRSIDSDRFYFVVMNREKEVLAKSEPYPGLESLRQGMLLTRNCSHGSRIENPFRYQISQYRRKQFRELLLHHSSYNLETPFGCPECGGPMILRIRKKGSHRGEQFWGCSKYPGCRGFLEYNLADEPEPLPV